MHEPVASRMPDAAQSEMQIATAEPLDRKTATVPDLGPVLASSGQGKVESGGFGPRSLLRHVDCRCHVAVDADPRRCRDRIRRGRSISMMRLVCSQSARFSSTGSSSGICCSQSQPSRPQRPIRSHSPAALIRRTSPACMMPKPSRSGPGPGCSARRPPCRWALNCLSPMFVVVQAAP